MAEIRAEGRRTGPWPWLLGLLALALLVGLIVGSLDDRPEPDATGEGTTQGAASDARPAERPPLPPMPVAETGAWRNRCPTTATASTLRAA
ncbi:MAG TPA: hypothetical protein VF121_09345 [Thermoanaerobaculia bacterium]|nr:hypothetical protein [Thermoanaerobaculia bacterium]